MTILRAPVSAAANTPPDSPAADSGPAPADEHDAALLELITQLEQAVEDVDAVLKDTVEALEGPDPEGSRRDLARQIVAGALLNRDNPDWDPADPSTHRPIPEDPLLVLLGQWSAQVEAASVAESTAP